MVRWYMISPNYLISLCKQAESTNKSTTQKVADAPGESDGQLVSTSDATVGAEIYYGILCVCSKAFIPKLVLQSIQTGYAIFLYNLKHIATFLFLTFISSLIQLHGNDLFV